MTHPTSELTAERGPSETPARSFWPGCRISLVSSEASGLMRTEVREERVCLLLYEGLVTGRRWGVPHTGLRHGEPV